MGYVVYSLGAATRPLAVPRRRIDFRPTHRRGRYVRWRDGSAENMVTTSSRGTTRITGMGEPREARSLIYHFAGVFLRAIQTMSLSGEMQLPIDGMRACERGHRSRHGTSQRSAAFFKVS